MLVLARCHMRHNQLSARQFLRACYQRQYGTDMPDLSLTNDTKFFEEQGIVPVYVINLLLDYYGEASCASFTQLSTQCIEDLPGP